MSHETFVQLILAIFSGVNLITTLKIAISIGEYKNQININTKEIENLRNKVEFKSEIIKEKYF